MKNRDQIRARNALRTLEGGEGFKGLEGGDVLSGFPALILGNGLMATIAYCRKQEGDYLRVCDAIARHLSDPEIVLLDASCRSTAQMLNVLVEADSGLLRRCTAESLAFLNFLRRFAKSSRREDR